jgi:1-deoxy-D-xylulose-5-phosphate reductoisomerase
MKTLSILGATGTIGQNTLDLVRHAPKGAFSVEVLAADKRVDAMVALAKEFNPKIIAMRDSRAAAEVKLALGGQGPTILSGDEGIIEAAACKTDWTMAGIVGMAGLAPLLTAIARGGVIAIANKEPLVAAGPQVLAAAEACGATLLPVDSEHNAVFQVFDPAQRSAIRKITLTASGGPFRDFTKEQMAGVTPEQAVAHPNWTMGAKISVDSATLMNKGLEIIEAMYLFNMPIDRIDALIHPQSLIHALVEYADGSILAQLGAPDMRTPIAHTLAWPDRMNTSGQRLDLKTLSRLDFAAPDHDRFPALKLCFAAGKAGQAACVTLNAANEVFVDAFLKGEIAFPAISAGVAAMLDVDFGEIGHGLGDLLSYDDYIRVKSRELVKTPPTTRMSR